MVRSMWLPVTSGVATVCVGLALWPSLASPANGLSRFSTAAAADALLQRLPLLGRSGSAAASAGWSPPAELQDLRVTNVSIHRVRYERREDEDGPRAPVSGVEDIDIGETAARVQEAEDTLVRSLFGSAWAAATRKVRSGRAPATSVVVTWEDHPLAAAARPEAETLCADAATSEDDASCGVPTENRAEEPTDTATSGRAVEYEVQVWVNGWGLDAFWHPANRKLVTRDPFVVVHGLPHEQEELAVRVRMKVRTRARLLAGLWSMTSEVDGPWSDVVTLSPAAEPALETLAAFFKAHQFLGGVLALLVALSALVILRLAVASIFPGRRRSSKPESSSSSSPLVPVTSTESSGDGDDQVDADGPLRKSSMRLLGRHTHHSHNPLHHHHHQRRRRVSSLDLEQEVADLRQELADSEAEVRRLMLFRGYGIDELRETELEQLETELRRTLKLVQKRRRLQHFESLDETEEEEEGEEEGDEVEQGHDGNLHNSPLGTVFEEVAT